jgi:hypothetical protein
MTPVHTCFGLLCGSSESVLPAVHGYADLYVPPCFYDNHHFAASPSAPQSVRSVGIVQQNQIKKARKLQDDLRAEEEKLQAAHLARLRRAAAAEVASDSAAKATSLSWLHCSLSYEEGEHLEHWLGLLRAILDMQEQQQQNAQEAGDGAATAAAEASAKDSSGGAAAAAGGGAGETGDIMVWIKQPANRRHHVRVALECLKELGAQDLPARVLLTHKVRWLWC